MMIAFARVLATISLLVAATASEAAPLISVNPGTQTANVGSSISIALSISGLIDGAAPSLGAYDLDLSFNPAVLAFSGTTFGDPILGNQLDLFGLGSVNGVTPSATSVNLFEISLDLPSDLDELQAGSFTLATLTFQATAVGISTVDIAVNALGDSLGDPLSADITSGTVSVQQASAIPEPSTLSLLLVALGCGLLGVMKTESSKLDGHTLHSEKYVRFFGKLRCRLDTFALMPCPGDPWIHLFPTSAENSRYARL